MPGEQHFERVITKALTVRGTNGDVVGVLPAFATGGAAATRGTATLVAGTVTVATTAALTGSVIQLTIQSLGTVTSPKAIGVTARVNGVSFTITSADVTDTSVIGWVIL